MFIHVTVFFFFFFEYIKPQLVIVILVLNLKSQLLTVIFKTTYHFNKYFQYEIDNFFKKEKLLWPKTQENNWACEFAVWSYDYNISFIWHIKFKSETHSCELIDWIDWIIVFHIIEKL